MTDYTDKTQNINFRNYMEMPSGMDFDLFLDTLNNHGLDVTTTNDGFFEDEEEDAVYNMHELGHHLVFFGRYLTAKVKGFEALRDEGITAIFEAADCSGSLSLDDAAGYVLGEWCSRNGVLYILHGDMVDTTVASDARDKRTRKKADIATAKLWLREMIHMQRTAA